MRFKKPSGYKELPNWLKACCWSNLSCTPLISCKHCFKRFIKPFSHMTIGELGTDVVCSCLFTRQKETLRQMSGKSPRGVNHSCLLTAHQGWRMRLPTHLKWWILLCLYLGKRQRVFGAQLPLAACTLPAWYKLSRELPALVTQGLCRKLSGLETRNWPCSYV